MIQVGDLVRIARPTQNEKNKLAIVVGIDYKVTLVALRFLDNNLKATYHISRLEKL